MIVQRRSGQTLAIHKDGRVGRVVHPHGPADGRTVYVHVTDLASANWLRAECLFRFAPEDFPVTR